MRVILSCLFAFGVFGYASADDEKKAETLKEKVAEIQKEATAASKELGTKYREAKTAQEKTVIQLKMTAARAKTGVKILAVAKEMPADEYAFDAVMIALQSGAAGAGDFMVEKFANDERILKAVSQLASAADGEKALAKLAEKTTSKDVRGIALYLAASTEIEKTDYPRTAKPLPEKEAIAKIAAATLKLDGVMKEYGETKLPAGRTGAAKSIAEAGTEIKHFVETLTVGKAAPNVECELLDDKKASLKDYRGNVVVLDIWATWCGPCKAMIPHERDMVKHFEGKKFKLVSVSADEKKDTLTDFLAKEEMPWTHWWAGKGGDMMKTYQVKFYPTVYILDAKGVIRGKHLRGVALEKFVEGLLLETESGS